MLAFGPENERARNNIRPDWVNPFLRCPDNLTWQIQPIDLRDRGADLLSKIDLNHPDTGGLILTADLGRVLAGQNRRDQSRFQIM